MPYPHPINVAHSTSTAESLDCSFFSPARPLELDADVGFAMDCQGVLECEDSAAGAECTSLSGASSPNAIDDTESSSFDASSHTYWEDGQTSETPQPPPCHCSVCLREALDCTPMQGCSNAWTASTSLHGNPRLVAGDWSTVALEAAVLMAPEFEIREQLALGTIPSIPTTALELIRHIQFLKEGLVFDIYNLKVCISFQTLEIATWANPFCEMKADLADLKAELAVLKADIAVLNHPKERVDTADNRTENVRSSTI